MARRRYQPQFHEPSLVPLADMLTNTVGIVIFILIFTVLTTNGTMITTRLPMEHTVEVIAREYYICANGKIYPLRKAPIINLLDKIKQFELLDGSNIFAKQANGTLIEDEFLQLTLIVDSQAENLTFAFAAINKPEAGLNVHQVMRQEGFFAQDVSKLAASHSQMIFWVKPDSIAVFKAARDAAVSAAIAYNWSPRDLNKPIVFSMGGADAPSL